MTLYRRSHNVPSHSFVLLWLLVSLLPNFIPLFSFSGFLSCSPSYRKQFIKFCFRPEAQTLCQTEVFCMWIFYKRNKKELLIFHSKLTNVLGRSHFISFCLFRLEILLAKPSNTYFRARSYQQQGKKEEE